MIGGLNGNIIQAFHESFETLCQKVFIEGYDQVRTEAKYSLDWKEDSFTNYIASFMRKSQMALERCLFIKTQVEPENDNLPEPNTIDDPNRQPRIDFWIGNFTSSSDRNEYYIEAKNLCENDWKKSSGTKVSAVTLKKRYITTGIENFKTGRYPKGCLAGYVLNGENDSCVTDINELLTQEGREKEVLKTHIDEVNYPCTYVSTHTNISLKHFFLKF